MKRNLVSNTLRDYQILVIPVLLGSLIACTVLALQGLNSIDNGGIFHIFLGILGVAFTIGSFFWILPKIESFPTWIWIFSILNCIGLTLTNSLEPKPSLGVIYSLMGISVITATIIAGRGPAYLILAVSALTREDWLAAGVTGDIRSHTSEIILIISFGIIIIETFQLFKMIIKHQMNRLAVINNVARSVASSLEIHQVISLLSNAIQKTIDADTYYVGMLDGLNLRLELLYDDGEFYPTTTITPENSLAGWVVLNRDSILMKDIIDEAPGIGINLSTIGKDRMSRSWMGTPLESGGELLGMVAVASYSPSQFDQSDLELLQNLAQHAAMAIYNAKHHEEVIQQTRLDSLTGAYNHRSFLELLEKEAAHTVETGDSISLIMLDIDFFKNYNDEYGHLIGDEVLKHLIEVIKANIKGHDVVGRWGGEEFSILLGKADGSQAFQVAERIRKMITTFNLVDRNNNHIPAPTISQGIAVFPDEARDIHTLIDLADQRLYLAKERGRDQVEPQATFWPVKINDPITPPNTY
jgi:diguanylate cyclase (GGDEF)-like protein